MLEQQNSSSIDINQLPDPEDQKVKIPKKHSTKRIPKFIVVFVLLFIAFYSYQIVSSTESQYFYRDKSISIIQKLKSLLTADNKTLKGESQDRINILLLGMGGPGHDGPYLTDTILVLSIRPSDKTVALLSIPRDLAVYIPEYGYRKINTANAYAEMKSSKSGGDFTRVLVSELLGIDIPYYIRVDFKAFQRMVDDLDGVTIDVEKNFTDSQYPTWDHKTQTIAFQSGYQNMDGDTALKYVRSRHGCCGEGGDFARANRQQRFISALKEKILSEKAYLDPKQLINVYDNYQENIDSNIKIWQMILLTKIAKKMDNYKTLNVVLSNDINGELENIIGADGAYMLQPIDGNYDILKNVAQNIFDYSSHQISVTNAEEPIEALNLGSEKATITVLNGTYITGLATKTSEKLKKQGYKVVSVGNAPVRDYDANYLYDITQGKYPLTLDSLLKNLNAQKSLEMPQWLTDLLNSPDSIDIGNPNFVIILGTNE